MQQLHWSLFPLHVPVVEEVEEVEADVDEDEGVGDAVVVAVDACTEIVIQIYFNI